MVKKIAFKGKIDYLQILNEKGIIDKKLKPQIKRKKLIKALTLMKLTRAFDEKAFLLQRQGRIGTFAPVKGQEASQVSAALTLTKNDFVLPSYRDIGVYLTQKMPIEKLFQYWAWDERGMQIPKNLNLFPFAIPVGTQMLHAVGFALAKKMNKEKGAILTFFGDGATSTGDFHEAMNLAGVFQVPLVLICENNQYAISLPVKKQTHSKTIAQKALAYGFEGIKVDGNDFFAVYSEVNKAMKKARKGKGPTLIECFTYRMENHTTADDWTVYRSKKEVEFWAKKDPIKRMQNYLLKEKIITKNELKKIEKQTKKLIKESIKRFDKILPPKIEDIFNYTYQEKTIQLKEQLQELKNYLEREKNA